MLSITAITSTIFCDSVEISRMVVTASPTITLPWFAICAALSASSLAVRAFSAVCRTIDVICSMLAAVSCNEAA